MAVGRTSLFDAEALAAALKDGRIESCILDGSDASFASEGSPLFGLENLHVTRAPRVAHPRVAPAFELVRGRPHP